MQTNYVSTLIALSFSIMLTACGGGSEKTDISEEPGPDGVAPTLTLVKIYNGFNSGNEVKLGDVVKVEFESSESIMKPTVTIAGVAATVSGQHHAWSAEHTLDDDTLADGPVSFAISFGDVSGVAGNDVAASTEGDPLEYCKEGCVSEGEAGGIAGDWKLAPVAGALGVGPVVGDISWWSSSEITLTDRDCLFDDIYRFGADGSFENVMGATTFTEDWQNGDQGEACLAPIAPHDGSNPATYVLDEDALTLTVDGLGAHIGLPKAINGGEISAGAAVPASIVYIISAMNNTEMTLDINFGAGYWRFLLQKEVTEQASPIIGDWTLAPAAGALGVGPVAGDISWWSSSEITLSDRDCLFDDIYRFNADGSFENVMGDLTFTEDWQNGDQGEACLAPIAPHDGSNPATYVFDEDGLTLTVEGAGAHVGLPKAINGGEISAGAAVPDSIVYTIAAMNDTAMTLDVNFGAGVWRFELVKSASGSASEVQSDLVGNWKISPEADALSVILNGNVMTSKSVDACLLDDVFSFGADGSFANVMGTETWLETWQGAASEGCGTPVAPHDGSNTAVVYSYNEAAALIKVTGAGGHIGLAKVIEGSELTDSADAPNSIKYTVIELTATTMTLEVASAYFGGSGVWRFKLVKD